MGLNNGHLLQELVWAWTSTISGTAAARCGNAKYLMALGVAWGPLLAAFRTGCSSSSWVALGSSLYVSSCLVLTLPCMEDDDPDDLIHPQSRAVQLEMV